MGVYRPGVLRHRKKSKDKPITLWECPVCHWYGSDPEFSIVYLTLENERTITSCPKCGHKVEKCL